MSPHSHRSLPRLPFLARLVALAGALLVAAAGGRAAPTQTATEAIRQANDRLRERLAEENRNPERRDEIRREIARELRGLLDIPFLARRALVDHWDEMTPRQRTEVQQTLQAIIERNYLNQLRRNLEYRTDYLGEQRQGQDVVVRTVIRARRRGRPATINVSYRVRAEGERWRIYDIVTEDVSVLQNYRGQFNRIIEKDGVNGLIARMKARLEKPDRQPARSPDPPAERERQEEEEEQEQQRREQQDT